MNLIYKTKLVFRKFFLTESMVLRKLDRNINDPSIIYEKEINLLPKLIKQGDIVIDIGANRGEFTYYLSKLVGDAGFVFAFEPGKRAWTLLVRTIIKYNLNNCIPIKHALGDESKKGILSTSPYLFREARINQNHKGEEEVVHIKTIDEMFLNYLPINFIKCDVDGFELNVIKGAIKTLSRYKPILLIEITQDQDKIMELLSNIGYKCYSYNIKTNQLESDYPRLQVGVSVWSSINNDLSNNNYIFSHEQIS